MFRSSPVSGSRYVSPVRPEPRGGKDGGSDIDEGDSVHDEASSLLRSDARPFPTPVGAAGGIFGGFEAPQDSSVDDSSPPLPPRPPLPLSPTPRPLVAAAVALPSLSEMTVQETVGQMMRGSSSQCRRSAITGGDGSGGEGGADDADRRTGAEPIAAAAGTCLLRPSRCSPPLPLPLYASAITGGDDSAGEGGADDADRRAGARAADSRLMRPSLPRSPLLSVYLSPLFPSSTKPSAITGGDDSGGEGGADDADRRASRAATAAAGTWLMRPSLRLSPLRPHAVPSLSDMTVEEKVGQMMQIDERALGYGDNITVYHIGSVLSGGGAWPQYAPNTPTAWADMVDNFQAKALNTRLRVPLLYGVDAVHGHNNVQGATIFPHHVGLGAAGNATLVEEIAAAVAKEVAATGVRWTFAPAVTVCLDPRWGRCYESYGADPGLVTELAIAEIRGWMAGNFPGNVFMAPTAKHYVGDGGTRGGVDRGETVGGEAVLRKVHLLPYVAAVAEGVSTIMASYSSWNGTKMHGNGYLLTDVLRKELGFVGLMVSDWEALKELPGSHEDQVALGVNSGLDMIMVPNDFANFSATLTSLVNSGRVPMSRIDEAVSRVLSLKHSLGLFDKDLVCARHSSSFFSSTSSSLSARFLPFFGCPEHRQLARKAVAASLVLLQDKWRRGGTGSGYNAAVWGRGRKKMFPLPVDGAKIVVAGSHANDIGRQCGGWTITWQGEEGPITKGTTIWQGLKELVAGRAASLTYIGYPPEDDRYENGTRKRPLEATGEAAAVWAKRARSVEADLGIIVVGEPPYAEYKGDDQQLELSGPARSTIFGICGRIPCVVVVVSGRPLNVTGMLPHLDALIAAWLPGSEGGGVADVLFDDTMDFNGKLPLPWFRSVPGREAMGHHREGRDLQPDHSPGLNPPLFPMGFGLSKTGDRIGIIPRREEKGQHQEWRTSIGTGGGSIG
ncbi:unnamed protein product [Closterium sp. Naga37s-1]|nr:unnamed protein product [Closterium sp. Naga37s-1]